MMFKSLVRTLVLIAVVCGCSTFAASQEKASGKTEKTEKGEKGEKGEKPAAAAKGDDGAKPADGESPAKIVSYGIGRNIGKSLASDGLDVDIDAILAGLKDGLADKPSQIPEEKLRDAFQVIQRDLEKKKLEMAKAAGDKNRKAGEDFLAANKKKPGVKSTESGLQYEVLKAGKGATPKASDTVKTHYHGTLIDGTVFDSSVDRGEPATFPVGGVIKGWTEALQLMKVGDKWRISVPSELAYGARGAGGKIGPNSVLVFEIELLEIEK